ncbi:NAD-dependent epimerase/dehydratase family protein [Candidatus Pelagibacter sp.]|nr:NAD-dependent epimerase/dehydratase family protein [Candidatus Pelagibacter sp.]
MMYYKNLIFGSSGVIGSEFINKLDIKNSLFTSRKKPNTHKEIIWKEIDLDKNHLNKLPKNVETIFFFASPYYTDKNLKIKDCFKKEFFWVKKIIKNIKCKKFVFTSSSSIYSINHQIGTYKKKIEKELSSSKIEFIQIWRPFSLIGFNSHALSDHFHNVLIKNVVKKKKNKINFQGSINDERGYSSVVKFCDEVYKKQKINKSFVYNYRNRNLVKLKKIIEIFKLVLKKNRLKSFTYKFKNLKTNKNYDYKKLDKVKTIFSNEKSDRVLYNHFNKVILHEKKL